MSRARKTIRGLVLGLLLGVSAVSARAQEIHTIGGVTSVPGAPGGIYAFNIPASACDGATDQSAAQNAVIALARTAAQASILNSVTINYPAGTFCKVGGFGVVAGGPLNYTGFTNNNLIVNFNGAVIEGQMSQGPAELLGAITAGSGGTPGTYTNVALSGGNGSGAVANIVVNGDGTAHANGVVLVNGGTAFQPNDALTASPGGITGFSIAVFAVGPIIDALGSTGIVWNDLHLHNEPAHEAGIGIQIGRIAGTATNGGGSGMVFNQAQASGAYGLTPFYNFSGEGVSLYDPIFANADAGANAQSLIEDGFNHQFVAPTFTFTASSGFVNEAAPVDVAQSFNQNIIVNGHFKMAGGSANISSIWWGGGRQHRIQGYCLNASGKYCTTIYNEAASSFGISQENTFDLHSENTSGGTDEYLISGNVAAPVLYGLTVKESALGVGFTNSMFKIDPASSVTSASMQGANISVLAAVPSTTERMFDAPQSWTSFSGNVYASFAAMWNEPNGWSGSVCLAANCWNSPDRPGPLDFLSNVTGAWSSARRLGRSYTGPIANEKGSSTVDIFAALASIDQSPLSVLLAGTTGTTVIEYDQSANVNNLNQSTGASQPAITFQQASLNGRTTAQFGDGGAVALPTVSTFAYPYASGGFYSVVVNQTAPTVTGDRLYNTTGGSISTTAVTRVLTFNQTFNTTSGVWTIPAISNGAHIIDLQYNDSSVANNPVLGLDGVNQTVTQVTAPVGTANNTAATMFIGNQVATAGVRGWSGAMAEEIFTTSIPNANVLDAVRRNQAGFYGLTTVQ